MKGNPKTLIRVSTETKRILESMKIYERESVEDVISDLIEDHLELNPAFKKEIEKSLREVKTGKLIHFSRVLKEIENGD